MSRHSDNITIDCTPYGLVFVHRQIPGAAVDYCGAVIHAGSRNDPADAPGLAHFVEHTIFKGTGKRSSWHIINRMERVGGELNAYTTKEETVVYTAAPRGNMSRSFELIADLLINSCFPKTEIDKEREVVADEINSYLDSPADAVFDDFEDLAFAGTPLGHNILGNTDALSKFDTGACRQYLNRWYTVSNMVVFYQGPASLTRVRTSIERYFAGISTCKTEHITLASDFQCPQFEISRSIGAHQAHTVMGCSIPDMYSPERYTYALLTNILGGPGMNSRLNVQLREHRGLVYSVEAATGLMHDCGLFTVYFGCDPDDTDKCCRLVRNEIEQMADKSISEITLNQAKKQYIGQLAVASDNRESLAISTGRATLYFNNVMTPQQTIDHIQSITPSQIREAAESISKLSRLTLT